MEKLTLFNEKNELNIKYKIKIENKVKIEGKKEIALLKSLQPKESNNIKNKTIADQTTTSKELIVPKMTEVGFTYDLHNDHWKYNVKGAFLDALGIKWLTGSDRKDTGKIKASKNGKISKIKESVSWKGWRQTPFLDFKEGDSIDSRCGTESLQVEEAIPYGWNIQVNKMIEGFVRYKIYKIKNGLYEVVGINSCTQMEFLEKLIYGKYEGE